ncbi:glycosyltransferase family 2 protein [Pedobacter polaris]|uniref:Glycosyltransferase family 2 protein n=1 Tax=Pedobacter polaris TaxID=2571273 RepID=A0A4U1CWU0_9SPHI|nr:glycosyltransferase [Pedobacter polaris]TKC12750.1 glycosyltransferase family 2 protein [Pedobacter polaris]
MLKKALDYLIAFYEVFMFDYASVLMFSYSILVVLSLFEIRKYLKRKSYINLRSILTSPHAPGITVIAPAYNEGLTIINNVHSLLSLNYPKFEVVIINDGSTDHTLQKLIENFNLVAIDYAYNEQIITQPVRQIYRSGNPAFFNLLVVDKVNGKSKADASNAGINISSYPYFLCTDVDCIIHKDTLLKLIKPFIEESTKVIATGAAIRISNSCEIQNGFMVKVKVPDKFLPLFQELEYIRAFLLGRMAWSKLNALMLVSGGLGLFDKEVAISAGGYDHKSFGEDMELITRMRIYMHDIKEKYLVKYIPESLCWTEVPATLKVFGNQRTRWSRGLAQNLWLHKKIIFNPKYGIFGMLSFPYWLFFEWLAPIIEATGIIYYIYVIVTGQINWEYAVILLVYVYSFSVMITIFAVLWDEITYKQYGSKAEVFKLCLAALVEPIFYHPLVVIFAIKGYLYSLTGKTLVWGNMQRSGFEKKLSKKLQQFKSNDSIKNEK